MIVCSCQGLTDHQIRDACAGDGCERRRPSEVHRTCGCTRECGRCLKTIKTILDEMPQPMLVDGDALIRMEAAE